MHPGDQKHSQRGTHERSKERRANAARAAGASVGLSGETIIINGGRPLTGRVDVKGSKNLVTKAMVAALLGDTPSELRDVPHISDVEVVSNLLKLHGVAIDFAEDGTMKLDPTNVKSARMVDIDAHAGSSRIPILFCGPLLHQLGEAFIPDLGGCHIGDRPIDFHLEVLRNFGAVIDKQPNGIRMSAPDGLKGAKVSLPYPSVGATEQVLLTSVRAQGLTELSGAAIEPEIMDLIAILQKMGAIISVEPNRTIRVTGVAELGGFEHRVVGDRLEAASWASLALATGGTITVHGVQQQLLSTFLNMYRRAGGDFKIDAEGDTLTFGRARRMLRPLALETDVHPGFMTDWQSPFVTALTQADGVSVVHETVYEDRLGYTDALRSLGAQIQVFTECLGPTRCRFGAANHRHSAVVVGPTKLHGAELVVPDLRAGFSYVIAAAAADGESLIHGVDLLDRGYADFRSKLSAVGVEHR